MVSIPLRTGLGFELIACARRATDMRLNPLTNGSRIRTSGSRAAIWPSGTSQSPYERVSDSNSPVVVQTRAAGLSQSPYERVSDSNSAARAELSKEKASQSPYERVSDSNFEPGNHQPRRSVSIPLRTGLGFERVSFSSPGTKKCLNPLTNGSRIRTFPLTWWRLTDRSQSPYERVSDSNRLSRSMN